MPVVIEKEGKTVSEATISACEELGVSRDDVDVEVLQEGSKGVFGIGEKKARIRARVTKENVTEKGLRAKKNLKKILGFIVSPYSVALRETSDRIKLEVRLTRDKGLIIGRKGRMIRSMEYIVGKIAGRSSEGGRRKRVSIDVDDYKKRKEQSVEKRVKEAAKNVRQSGKPVTLESLSSYERKLAYNTLKKESGVSFETEKSGGEKRIIVTPDKSGEKKKQKA